MFRLIHNFLESVAFLPYTVQAVLRNGPSGDNKTRNYTISIKSETCHSNLKLQRKNGVLEI